MATTTMLTLLAMEMLGMDDLEEVPVGYEEMDDEALNIKFRKLCRDIVRERVRNFIRQHQSSSYTQKKYIVYRQISILYSIYMVKH